jgi:hypothetical protein
MAYQKIPNLYKDQDILLFKRCYAMEKIHGTSAHISWKWQSGTLNFFSGGEKHDKFVALFDQEALTQLFKEHFTDLDVTVFGEAYGGKCQGMSATYGLNLKFVAFEVKINNSWLDVPKAEKVVCDLGLEFIHYWKIWAELEHIDHVRDLDSIQAVRNGMGEGHKMEGIVLRPLVEVTRNNGTRIVAKYKRDDFRETKAPRKVHLGKEKLKVLEEANAVAEEWVTEMRLTHILDKIENPGLEKMGDIIKTMIEDVRVEGEGEIVWSKEVQKAVGKATANMAKKRFNKIG